MDLLIKLSRSFPGRKRFMIRNRKFMNGKFPIPDHKRFMTNKCVYCEGKGITKCISCGGRGIISIQNSEPRLCDLCDYSGWETCDFCYSERWDIL